MEILVFGGTAEGRQLAEWLDSIGACEAVVCTATEYGGQLVDGLEHATVMVGPLDADGKERLVASHDFACIVDATHPFATHVTSSIAALAQAHDIPLLRLLREDDAVDSYTSVSDVEAAAGYVAQRAGNVLLTTGSKDLATFVDAMPDFADRLYARMLPVTSSVAHAAELGIPASHVIAMQGPYSKDLNCALMRQLDIAVMVTKSSGKAGGFPEKAEAARACGVELVVIERPEERGGLGYREVQERLAQMMGVEIPEEREEGRSAANAARRVYLVGIGLGDPDTMTVEAKKAIEASDLLIGAKRMLEPYADRPCERRALIKTDDIVAALRESDARVASILFSGDVGFYSGATALAQKLNAGDDGWIEVKAVPGISSVVCLCARLLTPWQDVHLVSAHGRECDPVAEVRTHAKTFMLTGGKTKVRNVCEMLAEAGLGNVTVHVGERLSYDDECITSGTAAEFVGQDFHELAVMLVENPDAPKHVPGKLES